MIHSITFCWRKEEVLSKVYRRAIYIEIRKLNSRYYKAICFSTRQSWKICDLGLFRQCPDHLTALVKTNNLYSIVLALKCLSLLMLWDECVNFCCQARLPNHGERCPGSVKLRFPPSPAPWVSVQPHGEPLKRLGNFVLTLGDFVPHENLEYYY